jgi:hypothetical protein
MSRAPCPLPRRPLAGRLTPAALAAWATLWALWLWPAAAVAGPWAIGQGRFFIDGRFTASTASEFADENGNRRPMRVVSNTADLGSNSGSVQTSKSSLTDLSGQLYVEYGALSRLTLTMALQFVRGISFSNPGGDVSYRALHIGDMELGGRITLFDDELTVALNLSAVIPTGATGTNIPIGQGDVRTEFRVLVGKIFERWRFYVSGELGIRFRGSATVRDLNYPGYQKPIDYSDEITYGLEGGYFWKTRRPGLQQILLGFKLNGRYSTAASVPDPYPNLVPPASAFMKLGPEIALFFTEKLLLHVGVRTIPLARSLPLTNDYEAGLGVHPAGALPAPHQRLRGRPGRLFLVLPPMHTAPRGTPIHPDPPCRESASGARVRPVHSAPVLAAPGGPGASVSRRASAHGREH